MKRLLPILFLVSSLFAQDKSLLQSAFESAGAEFRVPADVLRGIAFAETRWEQLEWGPGDTASCVGLPREYGVMALRSDSWFGHSLDSAAARLGADPGYLKTDPTSNIRGAAAYLRSLYDRLPIPDGTGRESLESWQNAIAAYCGIPQQELAQQHALEVFERVAKGYNNFGIKMTPRQVNLTPLHQSMQRAWTNAQPKLSKLGKTAAQPDYPDARFISAYPGHWYTTGGHPYDFVVIHDMEGYYLSVISYFQLSATQASAHYCINGLQDNASDRPAGDITQMVEEKNWAWHARCWNYYSLGIEHEGFVSNPAWFTIEQYLASAKLTRYMCLKYGIPMDRNHIIGHNQWQDSNWVNWVNTVYKQTYPNFDPTCNTHTDPGQYWDWDFYMQMVSHDPTPPQTVTPPPANRIDLYQTVSISFNQRMEPQSLQGAFSISPAIPGDLIISSDSRTITFSPTYPYIFDTTYTITIDTSAHNYLGTHIDADSNGVGGDTTAFTYSFQTVVTDTIPPHLVSSTPANNASEVSPTIEILLQYSEVLDPSTLQGGVKIWNPDGSLADSTLSIVGSIANAKTTLHVQPDSILNAPATYVIRTYGTMKDFGGNSVPVDSITFSTVPPFIVSTYPLNKQSNVSPTVEVLLHFNGILDSTSLGGGGGCWEGNGSPADTTPSIVASVENAATTLRVRSHSMLKATTPYVVRISDRLKDRGGNTVSPDSISFSTSVIYAFSGTVLDSVEHQEDWWQPLSSGSTQNVSATWTIQGGTKESGAGAGQLTYTFTQSSGGLIREYTPNIPSIDVGGSNVGVWVFGDNSGHQLELWFYYYTINGADSAFVNVYTRSVGYVNWTGWKLMIVPLSVIPQCTSLLEPSRKFAGFVLRQVASGAQSGMIYFDQLAVGNTPTNAPVEPVGTLPSDFSLAQNFPNPFNPTTTIEFDLPADTHVQLYVYNMLGQRVAMLLDQPERGGRHRVEFDGSGLPSGLYFYRLVTPGFTSTRKMVLIK